MKPKNIKLILPKHENDHDYDENDEEHSMIAIHFDTRIDSPGYFSTHDEIVFAESVAPGELKDAEKRAAWIYETLKSHM